MNLPPQEPGKALQTKSPAELTAYSQPANMWLDPNQEGDAGVNFIDVLHSLRRRWLPAILIGSVIGTLLAGLCYVLVPITYQAEGLLRVRMQDVQLLGPSNRMANEREYEVFKQTQAALLTSPFVLNAALRDPAVQATSIMQGEENPIEFLSDNLRANYSSKSELLTLSLRDDNKEEVITIVDAVLKAYQQEVQQQERNDKFVRLEALEDSFRDNQRSMREISEELHRLAEELGTADSEEAQIQQRLAQGNLNMLDRRRQALRDKFEEIQSQLVVKQTMAQNRTIEPHPFDVDAVLEKDRRYAELKEEYDYYQTQMTTASQTMKSGSPMVAQMQSAMNGLDIEMQKRRREMQPRIEHLLRRELYGIDDQAESGEMIGLQAEAQILGRRLQTAEQEYKAQEEEVKAMSGFSAELVTKKADLDGLDETNSEIGQEVARLKLNLSQPSRIQLLQQADVPDASSLLFKLFQMAGAWVVGFGLTVAGITAWDYLSRLLNSGKDVEKNVGIGVIGTLPQLTGGFSMIGNRNLEAAITDSVDSLRAAIMYGPGGTLTKSVVVTSALGGEGKSTVASQLAVSLARSGRRTLLIDGDIRKPSQHAVFGMADDMGLSDILRGQQSMENVVQATPAENLWILPAGRCDNTAFQALSGSMTPDILAAAIGQFDFVVVDAGPVLTGPEALIFGQHVDGAILSTRRDVSRVPKIDEARARLQSVNIKVLGAVVNGGSTEVRTKMAALPAS